MPAATPSIIGADLVINGNLITKGDIQLDGTLIGDVDSDSLTIGENAKVEGSVSAKQLRISGAVVGELSAENIVLTKSAKVTGDVIHESLEIEMGATVEGNLKRRQVKAEPAAKLAAVAGEDADFSAEDSK